MDSHIVDEGKVYEVRARADGGPTVINGRRGRIDAPPGRQLAAVRLEHDGPKITLIRT